jgi:hypothetical protein
MVQAMQKNPNYVSDPKDADIVFPAIDTIRQCEWPELSMGWMDNRRWPMCVPAETELGEFEVEAECGWCCPYGVDEFVDTVRDFIAKYGSEGKMFVYFRNAQDHFHKCHEFRYAKVVSAKIPATVRFSGFNLQSTLMDNPETASDTGRYPCRGVNMLTPLHPMHEEVVLDDRARKECDFDKRDLRVSFSGHLDPDGLRQSIFDLSGLPGTDKWHIFQTSGYGVQDTQMDYHEMLQRSTFAFAPRGDEHYTFRLTEILAAGAVPVIIDDDILPPYNVPLSDWALRVPESNVPSVVEMINSAKKEDICRMQKNGMKLWRAAKDVDGLVDSLVSALWDTRLQETERLFSIDDSNHSARVSAHHEQQHAVGSNAGARSAKQESKQDLQRLTWISGASLTCVVAAALTLAVALTRRCRSSSYAAVDELVAVAQ